MTENISYKKCTCDICGKEEIVNISKFLPEGWKKVEIGSVKADCCCDCKNAIEDILGEFINRSMNPETAYQKLFGGD